MAGEATEEKPLHVIELHISNVMRLRAVSIRPDGAPVVIVGGRNGQGKSSTLKAIAMALGGADAVPDEALRRGAERGSVILQTEEFRIERTFTAAGGTSLKVIGEGERKLASPQALLDSMCAKLMLDPLAFVTAKKADRVETVKELVPELVKQLEEIEENHTSLFEQRTLSKRELAALKARVEALPPEPEGELPESERSVLELLAELEQLKATADENASHRRWLQEKLDEAKAIEDAAATAQKEIDELEQAAKEWRAELEVLAKKRTAKQAEISTGKAVVDELVEPDLEPKKKEIAELEETNRKVRDRNARKALRDELRRVTGEVDEQTRAITHLDDRRNEAIAATKFPVDGLGFRAGDVTYKGLPLDQASQAELIRISVAIAVARSPRMRIALVRSGNDLDQASLQLLAEHAAAAGLQVFIERVSEDGAGCSVLIEDGMVKDTAAEAGR